MTPFGSKHRIFLAVAILVAAAAVSGHTSQQPKREVRAKETPLTLKLSSLNPNVCLGSSLDLELEVENVGAEEIAIDKAEIWASFGYCDAPDPKSGGGRGGGEERGCFDCRGTYLRLFPGIASWNRHQFKLDDSFFEKPGKYLISTSVSYKVNDKDKRTATSNQVTFEISSCGVV